LIKCSFGLLVAKKSSGYPRLLNLVSALKYSILFRRTLPIIYNGCGFYSVNNQSRITSGVINKILANQGVSITQKELNILLNIKGVTFDLPFNSQTFPALYGLVGKPKSRRPKAGIYIFTHLATGRKYVGSSNSLSIRLEQYFNPTLYFIRNMVYFFL
jgi:hypothetical protein